MKSPFKFLDAYNQADVDIFFGREKETEALYDALSGVKHLLVYGPSGAGKTSLIECGLRNQFSEADWFALTIRKGENINQSVFARIDEALQTQIDLDPATGLPKDATYEFGDAIEELFDEKFQPIYLLFDQFEELLILGEKEEQEAFFRRLDKLIRYKVPCRIMLIMREEFIGYLSEFEELCPSIFRHRFRLEKMGRGSVAEVIENTLESEEMEAYFEVEESEEIAQEILSKIPDSRKEIELTYVQVFLDELWQRAKKEQGKGKPTISPALIQDNEKLENLLDSFLKKQLAELKTDYPTELPIEVLVLMISKQNTKLQLPLESIAQDLQAHEIPTQNLADLMPDLEERRIVRSVKVGDKSQYEISHDTLALVVGQNRTEEMKLREKANDIYEVYAQREGYFSEEDLDLLRIYAEFWKRRPAFEKRIQDSEAHIKAEKERALAEAKAQAEKEAKLRGEAETAAQKSKKNARVAFIIALVALVVAVFAGIFYFQAEEARDEADKKTEEAETERDKANQNLVEFYKAEITRYENEIEIHKTNIKSFERLKAIELVKYEKRKKDSINTKIKELQTELQQLEK